MICSTGCGCSSCRARTDAEFWALVNVRAEDLLNVQYEVPKPEFSMGKSFWVQVAGEWRWATVRGRDQWNPENVMLDIVEPVEEGPDIHVTRRVLERELLECWEYGTLTFDGGAT